MKAFKLNICMISMEGRSFGILICLSLYLHCGIDNFSMINLDEVSLKEDIPEIEKYILGPK